MLPSGTEEDRAAMRELLMWTMTPDGYGLDEYAQLQLRQMSIFPRLAQEELEEAVADPDVDIETVIALAERRAQWD